MARMTVRRIAMLSLGWTLVGLGVVGLALPFLQGVLMIFAGLAILSRESEWVRGHVSRYRARHPELDRRMRQAGDRMRHLVPDRWKDRSRRPGTPDEGPVPPDDVDAGPERLDVVEGVAKPDLGWQNTPSDETEDPHGRS